MNLIWTIVLAWLALQLPLAVLIGKFVKRGMGEPDEQELPSRKQAVAQKNRKDARRREAAN